MNRTLTPVHKRYIRNEMLLGCIINALIACAFTFLLFRDMPKIDLWGADGIALDLFITIFMLTLFANLAIMLITRKRVREGSMPRLCDDDASRILGCRVPGNAFLRALSAAVLMTVIVGPLSVVALVLLGVSSMPFWPFVAFKMVYGALVGSLSAPALLRTALADPLAGSAPSA